MSVINSIVTHNIVLWRNIWEVNGADGKRGTQDKVGGSPGGGGADGGK